MKNVVLKNITDKADELAKLIKFLPVPECMART